MTFRNSLRHLFGTWLVRLPALVLVTISLDRYAALLSWWWFELLLLLFVSVTVPVLVAPVWAARFRTLTVDGDVLVLRLGWFAPETRITTRAQVTSVQVDEPLSQRLSGVRSVTILTSGATSSTIEMPALLPADAVALERLLADAQPSAASAPDDVEHAADRSVVLGAGSTREDISVPGAAGRSVVYRANVRDIVATSLSGGYVLFMAAAVIGAVQEVGGLLGGTVLGASWGDPGMWVLAGLALPLGVVVLIASRFKGFRIEQAAGHISIAYGALERSRHTISPGQVVAVTVIRTPVDLVLGSVRLVLSTAWLSDGSRKRLMFPSMPPAVAARVVGDALGRQVPELFAERSPWWAAGPVPALAVAGAVAYVGVPGVGPGGTAAIIVGGLVLVLVAVRYMLSTMSATPDHDVVCHTVGLSSRVTVYLPGTVSCVIERRLFVLPVRNVTVLGWAHRRFLHRVPSRSGRVAADIRRAVRSSVNHAEQPGTVQRPAFEEICAPVR